MKIFNFKKLAAVLITVSMLFTLVACNNTQKPEDVSSTDVSSQETSSVEETPAQPTTITDREGKTITIPEKMDKIISMAPSVTETLVNLGFADKLVAVDKYSVGIAGLPENLPTYDIMAPDTESIAALSPDIIFATGMSKADGDDPFKPVTDLGVLMTYIPSSTSIQGIKDDIMF
ncbi:MAG: ABC transporter substrate-binding protein, partial [Oscillospiraceae bacterium]